MKTVAIVQSSYIPWKGYFDLVRAADEFILYDDAQFTVRDWRSRNRIKTERGPLWLTIPVMTKGKRYQPVKDVQVSEADWGARHWTAISHAYGKAKFFKTYREVFEPLYRAGAETLLSRINRRFIEAVNGVLGVKTKISFSMDYGVDAQADKTDKLLQLCRRAGASEYLSGPRAKDYMDEGLFKKAGIRVRYADYSGYPEYKQLFGTFVHELSILDLLFNEGGQALKFMKDFRRG